MIQQLIYIDDDSAGLTVELSSIADEDLIIECSDPESNEIIEIKKIEPGSNKTRYKFKELPRSGHYQFALKSNDDVKYYSFYFPYETFEEWLKRLKIDLKSLARIKNYYFSNGYQGKENAIEIISKKLDMENLDEVNALNKLIADFNTVKKFQNTSPFAIAKNKNIKIVSVDDSQDYYIDIEAVDNDIAYYDITSEDVYMLKSQPGLYKINIYYENELVQVYQYRLYNDTVNKLIYKKEDEISINIPSDIEDILQKSDEQKILSLIDLRSPQSSFLPVPHIEVTENKMFVDFGEESEDVVLDKIKDLRAAGINIYIYFAEYDSLLSNKNHDNYRKILLPIDSEKVTDNVKYDLFLNDERYFYWLGTGKNIILSNVGTIDLSDEDEIDYNQTYAELKTKRHLKNFINTDYKDETSNAIQSTMLHDNLAFEDILTLYQGYLLQTVNDREKYKNLIKCVEDVNLRFAKNFDHTIIENITVKYNYKEISLKIKNGSDGRYLINTRKYSLLNPECVDKIKKICDDVISISAEKNSVTVIKIIDTNDFSFSRYIMLYNYAANNIMKVYTNGLEKENIYGL